MSTPRTLGLWYADPLSPEEATLLLAQSEAREQRRKRHGGNTLTCMLQRMVARFWLDTEIRNDYLMLLPAATRSAHGRALLELVYGQLLVSRRLAEGMPHLEKGFRLAANLFAAEDYLVVMNRHRLLCQLPVSAIPAKAEALKALMTSARVIERMRQSTNRRPQFHHDPNDTYG